MRVLQVNKFYYPRGGDCIVMMGTERLLRAHGHEVAVFAMQYPDNVASPWSGYWPGEVSFGGGARNIARAFTRMMGYGEVATCFGRLMDEFKPDVVHLHNIHSYLSPVVARVAHERGCRVVWTLHDYKPVCPSYSMLRDGKPCELCLSDGNAVVKHRCMKGSLPASVAARIEALKWNSYTLQRYTDAFICPSRFMRDMMVKGGYDEAKLQVLPNFIDAERAAIIEQAATAATTRGDHCCYVGRLSPEKGVDTLLEAVSRMPEVSLTVVGGGPLEEQYRERYATATNIRFTGQCTPVQAVQHVMAARLLVVPSVWYENNPLSVIEALCAGTPVVGARIGGIPELIDAESGMTFAAGDVNDLTAALKAALTRRWDNAAISTAALKRYSLNSHYEQLMRIYNAQP